MLIELGNHDCVLESIDERPKVTRIEIPDYDDGSTHDNAIYEVGGQKLRLLANLERHLPEGAVLVQPGPRSGGHSHDPGELSAQQFKEHITDARLFNQGITQLPGHEALLAVEGAWPKNGSGRPKWVNVKPGLRSDEHAADLAKVLSDFYECPTLADHYGCDEHEAHQRKEIEHWTQNGPPGVNRGLILPDLQAVYTNDGRVMNNDNDGGDSLTAMGVLNGVGTGSTSTTLTGCSGLTTNGLAGHRVYVHTTSGPVFVWGNVISNTTTAITVDQWYVPATPSGSAGANPATDFAFVTVDGGFVSTWFSAIGTGGSGWAAGDHTIAVSSGSAEYTQAGGTMIRKQCPVASTSGVASRTVTLVPVFTANASDVANLPKVVSVVAFFASMVVSYGGAGGPMKFIDAVSPTATMAALNDQLTLTDVLTGS